MHRFSGIDNPEAPLSHHWLDSTHISFGVLTLGWVRGGWKLEASAFNGHEPDPKRYHLDAPKLNSYSFRASYQPTPNWSLQANLNSPVQLEPGVDATRATASVMYNRPQASSQDRPALRLVEFVNERSTRHQLQRRL